MIEEHSEIVKEAQRWLMNNKTLEISKTDHYSSPRISSEIPDCSMPLTFDHMKWCSYGCLYCVIAGTQINTKYGPKPIEDLKEGDQIYSYNVDNKQVEIDIISKTMSTTTNEILEIELENGTKINITGEHPIYVENKGWVEAKDLQTGDDVVFKKNAAISYRLSANNPMKREEVKNKQAESMRERYASGELDWLKEKVGASASRRITQYNKTDKARKDVSDRMTTDNPMQKPGAGAKLSATKKQQYTSGELIHPAKGNKRPDLSERMTNNNPMKDLVKRKATLQKIVKSWIANGRISKGEICVGEALKNLHIDFVHQHVVEGPKRVYSLDFFLKEANLCIEYDGHSRHYSPKGIDKDIKRDAYILQKYGTKTIRIHRDEAFIGIENLASLIEKRLSL